MEDNGLCWVTKEEFFQYFPTIYVSAFNMTRLKDPKYVNDLKDDFTRRPKVAAKPKKAAPPKQEEELKPIHVNKKSDPKSPYKIVEQRFNGGVAFCEMKKDVVKGKSIADVVDMFQANPEKYLAVHYQNNMVDEGWPADVHVTTVIYRAGTDGVEIDEVKDGKRTMLTNVLR